MAVQLASSMEGESYSDKGKTDPVQSSHSPSRPGRKKRLSVGAINGRVLPKIESRSL